MAQLDNYSYLNLNYVFLVIVIIWYYSNNQIIMLSINLLLNVIKLKSFFMKQLVVKISYNYNVQKNLNILKFFVHYKKWNVVRMLISVSNIIVKGRSIIMESYDVYFNKITAFIALIYMCFLYRFEGLKSVKRLKFVEISSKSNKLNRFKVKRLNYLNNKNNIMLEFARKYTNSGVDSIESESSLSDDSLSWSSSESSLSDNGINWSSLYSSDSE